MWLACILAALVAAAALARAKLLGNAPLPAGLIQVNGRIEGDRVSIASKHPGRIETLLVREGDSVTPGQVLAKLDDGTVRARVAQAEAAWEVASARVTAAEAALALMVREVPLQTGTARANVRAADAAIGQARVAEAQAQREHARVRKLFESQVVDAQSLERASLALDTAGEGLRSAEASRQKAQQSLLDSLLGSDRVKAKEAELQALRAGARQAEALLAEARSALDDLTIKSPIAGTLTVSFIEGGEVVGAGTPLLEIINLDRLYMKGFVAEPDVGKIRLGLGARIYTDAFPEQAFPAELRYIASRAEFTPKEVQTRDERIKLVYAVKLYVTENRARKLSPGLPADAVIRWQEHAPWQPPRW